MLVALQKIGLWSVPVLFAITVHEVAHGWVARLRGDPTAARLGRLTLNPVRHVDLVGTIIVPITLLLVGQVLAGLTILFGWAKPVPVDWRNLRNPRRDMALVAAAGPLANLLMGAFWAVLTRLAWQNYDQLPASLGQVLVLMGVAGVSINVVLMVLNLFPLPPLDGGRVAVGLLPVPLARGLQRAEPWGLVIVVTLLVTGWLGTVLTPFLRPVLHVGAALCGLTWDQFQWVLVNIT